MHKIVELKEKLIEELEEYGNKGELSMGDLDTVDKLAHATKNLCKVIKEAEEEQYSREGGSYRGSYDGTYDNGSYEGGSYEDGSYRGRSYSMRRGRGPGARRDSMGRYSSDNGQMVSELRELMADAPDERTRSEFQKFIQKMEQM